jgi:protein TonB
MDLQSNLIESGKLQNGTRKGWKASIAALGVHGLIIAFVVVMSATAAHKVAAEDKPIRAFITAHAAPPPPPPPPPPPAASSAPKSTPVVKPTIIPKTSFVQPKVIPKDVPKVQPVATTQTAAPTSNDQPSAESGGVPGGVEGGVAGGVQGGVVGGQVGGVLGGTLGGQQGGVVGGTPGGTGTEPAPAPPPPPPPPKPEGPLRVGGDVKAPVVEQRVDPIYTDMARKTRVTGIVIVEAIINKDGEVEQVKVIKGLPMGLSESAAEAVRKWKFKPGTLNGEPVEVIFNLTVNFKLD